MKLKHYLLLMTLGTVIAWLSWVMVMNTVTPEAGYGQILFYISLLLACFGSFSLLGYAGRALFSHGQLAYQQVNVSNRQGVLLSALVSISLWLQASSLLAWWSVLLLVVLLTLVELFFVSYET
ncbi:MAG: hypothetical protein V1707_02390 [bacterium]